MVTNFETERLICRPFVAEDWSDMLENWIADPEIQGEYGEPVYTTEEQVKAILSRYRPIAIAGRLLKKPAIKISDRLHFAVFTRTAKRLKLNIVSGKISGEMAMLERLYPL